MVSVAPRKRTSGSRTQVAQNGDDDARAEGGEEARGHKLAGKLFVLRAQRVADVGAAAHAEHKGDGLNDGHSGEDHAHRAGGGGAGAG